MKDANCCIIGYAYAAQRQIAACPGSEGTRKRRSCPACRRLDDAGRCRHAGPVRTESRAADAFRNEQVDIILFGHSHIPLYKKRNGVWLFNPGSPTDKRRQSTYSFGIWTIRDGALEASIHYYKKDERA